MCDLAEEVRRGQTETTLDGFATGGRVAYGFRRIEVADPRGRVDRTGQPAAVEREIANYAYTVFRKPGGYTQTAFLRMSFHGIG